MQRRHVRTGQTGKYSNMKTFLMFLAIVTLSPGSSCSKSGNKRLTEGTIEFKLHDTVEGNLNGNFVKLGFAAVVSDSRCPANAICVWQGAATATFSFSKNGSNHLFNLSYTKSRQ